MPDSTWEMIGSSSQWWGGFWRWERSPSECSDAQQGVGLQPCGAMNQCSTPSPVRRFHSLDSGIASTAAVEAVPPHVPSGYEHAGSAPGCNRKYVVRCLQISRQLLTAHGKGTLTIFGTLRRRGCDDGGRSLCQSISININRSIFSTL